MQQKCIPLRPKPTINSNSLQDEDLRKDTWAHFAIAAKSRVCDGALRGNSMNTIKVCTAAIAIGCFASAAGAASYNITGTQAYGIDVAYSTDQIPAAPTFTNGAVAWEVDPANPVLSGSFHFSPYNLFVQLNPALYADVHYVNHAFSFENAAGVFDSSTRTLTFTSVGFTESNGSVACYDQGIGVCWLVPGAAVPGSGAISLVFDDASLTTFTGVAHINQQLLIDESYRSIFGGADELNATSTLTFSGAAVSAVPVPAAAWLFGSSLGPGRNRAAQGQVCIIAAWRSKAPSGAFFISIVVKCAASKLL